MTIHPDNVSCVALESECVLEISVCVVFDKLSSEKLFNSAAATPGQVGL